MSVLLTMEVVTEMRLVLILLVRGPVPVTLATAVAGCRAQTSMNVQRTTVAAWARARYAQTQPVRSTAVVLQATAAMDLLPLPVRISMSV
jgi:hypothetical protein